MSKEISFDKRLKANLIYESWQNHLDELKDIVYNMNEFGLSIQNEKKFKSFIPKFLKAAKLNRGSK